MAKLKTNIYLKIGAIVLLIMLLMLPTTLVRQLIGEREYIKQEAITEVSSKWGRGQTLTGPYVSIPYHKYVKHIAARDSAEKIVKVKDWIHVLPESLNIEGQISPEKRYRGIYEVVVYDSDFRLSGDFAPLDLRSLDIDPKNIQFEKASLNLGISDLKGIEKQIELEWEGEKILFDSGLPSKDLAPSGINAPLNLPASWEAPSTFSLQITLKGSQYLYFVPVGKTTDLNMKSNWPTPSFTGTYLPDQREVNADGFTANWNILHLNRNYPQVWTGASHRVEGSTFGTNLLLPIDNYQKADRVAKYAILFLALTFMVFFFVEVLQQVFIHPIQYLLVGLALVLFYTLLLSFSEHIGFNAAYVVASLLTLLLVTAYTGAILKSRNIAALILGILLILYSFIFTIIQLEDYALLMGSLGLFLILGLVMYFSRKINWYDIQMGSQAKGSDKGQNSAQ
jgi:inner membrane protein